MKMDVCMCLMEWKVVLKYNKNINFKILLIRNVLVFMKFVRLDIIFYVGS